MTMHLVRMRHIQDILGGISQYMAIKSALGSGFT
jgi:hypothetical protein